MRRPADLTTSNWTAPPHNCWGFWHVRELTKTARISRGTGPVTALPPHWGSLDDFIVTMRDASTPGASSSRTPRAMPPSCDAWSRTSYIDEALGVSVRSN